MINNELYLLAEQTVSNLKKHRLLIATAESCTGGLLSGYITSISGASEIFEMGIASYSNRIKHEKLGVPQETLDKYGAVSEQTAALMAEGIRISANADIGISVTGVAGPDSSEGHPPGYVFISLSAKETSKTLLLNIKPLSRDYVRLEAIREIFNLINNYIEEFEK